MADFTPAAADALGPEYKGRTVTDPDKTASGPYDPKKCSAKYFALEVMNEILGLQASTITSKEFQQIYTCVSGINVGDIVYCDSASHIAKADSTNSTKAFVIGFVKYKPTTTTAILDTFVLKTGLSGLTQSQYVYLKDDGSIGSSAGTVPTVLGYANTTTSAVLFANPSVSGIPDNSVLTTKIASNAVTYSKLDSAIQHFLRAFTLTVTGTTAYITVVDALGNPVTTGNESFANVWLSDTPAAADTITLTITGNSVLSGLKIRDITSAAMTLSTVSGIAVVSYTASSTGTVYCNVEIGGKIQSITMTF